MLLSGLINQYKIYLAGLILIITFWAGYKLADTLQKSQQVQQYHSLLKTIKDNDAKSRQVIAELQEKNNKQILITNKLTERLKNVKIFSNTGNFTDDAVRLWNDSLKGIESPVSKDSSGTSSISTASSNITIDDAMHNKIVNDAICNGIRDQLISIIKWDKEVWHDFDSAGNLK